MARALKHWPDLFQLNALYGAVLVKLREDLAAYQALHRAHQLDSRIPRPRTCSTPQPSNSPKRARAPGNMLIRCGIWKNGRPCGRTTQNHTAAWLKSTSLPAVPRRRLPNSGRLTAFLGIQQNGKGPTRALARTAKGFRTDQNTLGHLQNQRLLLLSSRVREVPSIYRCPKRKREFLTATARTESIKCSSADELPLEETRFSANSPPCQR